MTARARAGAATAAALLLLACGSSRTGAAKSAAGAPLSRTEPYLVMTNATTGIAVWPSGSSWLLLSTSDGFSDVTNRTPQAVDTEGGLAVAATADRVVAVVGAYKRLVRSPVLTADRSWRWDAAELPGSVSGSHAAASAVPLTVVTSAHRGTLEERAANGWRRLTSATSLGAGLRLESVTWADSRVGWLTGTAQHGASVYVTRDGGTSWSPLSASGGRHVSALPPCGAGRSWALPVLRAGSMSVLRTSDGGMHWTGATALAGATPVFGCSGRVEWTLVRRGGTDHLVASTDGGATWRDRGVTPSDVTNLSPTGADSGYATSGGPHPGLWRVTQAGARFTRIALPAWVASIGEQVSGGS